MQDISIPKVDWSYDNQDTWCPHAPDSQSPINITASNIKTMSDSGELFLDYSDRVHAVIDTGYSIQGFADGSANINGRLFNLQQFHFHAHSEHQIDGEAYPLELHFVHESQNGRLAVLAVFLKIGLQNPTFQQLIQNIGNHALSETINLTELIPENKNYYHYLGSLTTPPLSENVEWYIFEQPIEISTLQLKQLTAFHNGNHRHIQNLNGRTVLKKDFH